VARLMRRAACQPADIPARGARPHNSQDGCVTLSPARGFPNLSQWTFCAVDRIVIRNWQSSNLLIGFRSLPWLASKQVPLASVRVSPDNRKVRAGLDFLVGHTGWNYNDIARTNLERPTILATKPEGRSATINTKDFVRGSVIMGKRIHAVSPRIAPVVLSKTFFENGSRILPIHRECPPIN